MVNNKTTIEVVRIAITGERESTKRYLRFALETKELSGKNMYILLATDEIIHQELLERISTELNLTGTCAPLEIPATILEKIAPQIDNKTQRIKGREEQNALDALLTALKLEISARDFYRQQAEKITDKTIKQIFLRIAQMEQTHADLIQAEIDHLQKFGFWLDFKEFTLEANP